MKVHRTANLLKLPRGPQNAVVSSSKRASPSYGAVTFYSTVLSFVCEEAILRKRTAEKPLIKLSSNASKSSLWMQGIFEYKLSPLRTCRLRIFGIIV